MEVDHLDQSLVEQLQRTFSRHISFTKKLSVSGIISYSIDGSQEKFVKINFSFDERDSPNNLERNAKLQPSKTDFLNIDTGVIESQLCTSDSPPILPPTNEELATTGKIRLEKNVLF